MNDRSLKKSLSGKTNRPADFIVGDADENLDHYSVNRGTSLDAKHSFIHAISKPEPEKHANDPLYTVFEVPLGTLSRLVLEARNVTSKLQSISTTRATSKSESEPSSKPTRSNSTIRPSNIPTLRPSNIPTIRPSNIPTIRSSSVPKKTTTASASASATVSSPKRTVSRSLTPVSRKTASRSPTPSRISTTTSVTPSFKKAGDTQRSRSLTPRSKPQITSSSPSPSSKTYVRSASATTPRTPPRLKETVTLAFGRPVGATGNVNSPRRNTSPDVTRSRPKVHSASSLIPTFSGVSHTTASPKSVKPSATVADSTRSGRKLSKASVQLAINHLDIGRNGKVSPNPFSSTMLYPHSIRSSSSGLRKRCGSEGSSSNNSNHEEEDGKSLTKEEGNTDKNDSARYDALLMVKDVKDTNWLLNIDDESTQSLMLDNAFDSPPELFPPL
ncbi:hypothetical protein AALP_AA5G139900 [Arabis alpina]|uniref:Uncharacterized protein n=1 Tax=Arabis alpina TaxID=50452 RepID=A0A087GWZ6_ARAAL|nr:hypothetical protein AALP_AA5G139900 [Arabis alpina]